MQLNQFKKICFKTKFKFTFTYSPKHYHWQIVWDVHGRGLYEVWKRWFTIVVAIVHFTPTGSDAHTLRKIKLKRIWLAIHSFLDPGPCAWEKCCADCTEWIGGILDSRGIVNDISSSKFLAHGFLQYLSASKRSVRHLVQELVNWREVVAPDLQPAGGSSPALLVLGLLVRLMCWCLCANLMLT